MITFWEFLLKEGSYIAALNVDKKQSSILRQVFLHKIKDHIEVMPHPIYLKVLPGETEKVLERLYRIVGFRKIKNPNPDERVILMRKILMRKK